MPDGTFARAERATALGVWHQGTGKTDPDWMRETVLEDDDGLFLFCEPSNTYVDISKAEALTWIEDAKDRSGTYRELAGVR